MQTDMSFKEKYLRLRERFDKVAATQRQYTTNLQAAKLKARKLKEENNHLLDLLSEHQQMTGSGPTTDSDTSMDDSDDDHDEDEFEHGAERGIDEGDDHLGPFLKRRLDSLHQRPERGRQDMSSSQAGNSTSQRTYTVTSNGNNSSIHSSLPSANHSRTTTSTSRNGGTAGNGEVSTSNVKKEQPDGSPPKQTRRATKRADRGRPRPVVPLKTNPDGSLNYPIIVGKGTNEVIIESMGRIVWNGRGYHNHRYIFPVGFRSKKQYTSLSDTSKKTYFISEILDGGEQPIFQITLEDMPEKVFRHSSSSGAWELALKGLMELGFNAKTHASGPDMYGLTNLGVIKYIQEMPNAHRCRRYMPLKWIIDEENVEGRSLEEAQQQTETAQGSKSPGRKKKINNSIYASNHSSALREHEEAMAPLQPPKPPHVPRKYTKRKVNPPPTVHDSGAAPSAPLPEPAAVLLTQPMEDVRAEHDPQLPPPTLHTESLSIKSDLQQSSTREKDPMHTFDHPAMEP